MAVEKGIAEESLPLGRAAASDWWSKEVVFRSLEPDSRESDQ